MNRKKERYFSMKNFHRHISIKTFFLLACTLQCILLLSPVKAEAKPGDDYSPAKAIAYADSCFKEVNGTHQASPSKKYGSELCAGYVSQCLREGGMSEDASWYWHGIGKTPDAWRISTSLYSYLKKCGYQIISSPNISQVNPGDVIFYYTGSGWGHCAICVGKNSAGTPLINAYNNPHYHYSNWRLYYSKVCVVSMDSKTQTPEIEEAALANGKEITLSCATSDSTIYYTTDGKNPTKSSTVYKKPFTLKKSSEIKAFAVSESRSNSDISSSYINTEKVLEDGIYLILPTGDKTKTLGISSSSTKSGAAVKLLKKNENYDRKITLTYVKNGYYTITFLHSGMALTEISKTVAANIDPTSTESAVTIKKNADIVAVTEQTTYSICQKKASGAKNQQWKLICTGKNKFILQNAKTSHYLTLDKALTTGEKAYPEEKSITAVQEFTITPTLKSEIKLTDEKLPVSLKLKQAFDFYGILTSNYKLASVQIIIQDKNKKTTASASDTPNKTTYSILTLSPKIKFGKLSAGTYSFIVKAKDATGQTTVVVNKKFKVTK
ncbi:MAG: chitobiase/beta-hexosaminidase C-terminal domain-containing protein [Lachnospiraceae bacterium]|nr:chitobiase/beta-hexosaminidase C-terminal domain-containing protein [Lachnospiraceae bacterium]